MEGKEKQPIYHYDLLKKARFYSSSKDADVAVHLIIEDICRALEGKDELTCMPVLDVFTTRILELIRTKCQHKIAIHIMNL